MNENIFYFFYNLAHRSELGDAMVIFLANFLPYAVVFLAILFLIFKNAPLGGLTAKPGFRQKIRDFFLVFLSAFSAWFLVHVLKLVFQAERPFDFFGVTPLFYESGYAFPSGHAVFFSALAVALYFYNKKVGYVFGIFALIIGVARIAAGVHFPIDILTGLALGALVSIVVRHFYNYCTRK